MKKTALIGLMTLSIGGVAQAASLEFIDTTGDGLWATVGDDQNPVPAETNWQTAAAAPHYTVPGTGDDVDILSDAGSYEHALITNYSAFARNVTLTAGTNNTALGGNLTVAADGVLTARAIVLKNYSRLFNFGDIDLSNSFLFTSIARVENYGTIDTALDLSINKSATFDMLGGAFTAVGNLLSGSTGGQKLNVHGGIMNFTDTNAFDVGTAGNLIVDFDGVGELVFDLETDSARYTALSGLITDAIAASYITYQGGAYDIANMTLDGTNNIITLSAIPEPGTYALLAGCFGLTWVMLRRRR